MHKTPTESQMDYVSVRDLEFVAQHPYLVDGLVPANSVILVSAPSNAGKTAILFHIATALAEQKAAFGVLACRNEENRPILYVNGELGGYDLKSYAVSAARGLGLQEAAPSIMLPGKGIRGEVVLGSGTYECFEQLESVIAQLRPTLVVFDTLRALFDLDENDQRAVGVVGKSLTRIANAHDCSVILAHHTRKPGQFASGAQAAVSGSTYLVGMVDAHIALQARDGKFAHKLEIVKDRRSPNGGRREYTISGSLVGGISTIALSPMETRTDRDAHHVAALRKLGYPLTRKQILDGGVLTRRIYDRLRRDGQIVETEVGSGLWRAA